MEALDTHFRRRPLSTPELTARCAVSLLIVLLSHLALLLVTIFTSPSPFFLSHLFFAVVGLLLVAGFAKATKRLLKIRPSPPAMVLFHLLFLWAVYFAVTRRAVSRLRDVIFNGGITLLIIAFSRILSSDPGFVQHSYRKQDCKDDIFRGIISYEETTPQSTRRRVRYCTICEDWIIGFDHHCPAFGNCIGKKNHRLFIALLIGFITMETLYSVTSLQYSHNFQSRQDFETQNNISENVVMSTMLFSHLQVLWQVLFLAWHIYCVCLNITTDEWTNWKRYPEFHLSGQSQTDHLSVELRFTNPYDKGVFCNLRKFVLAQDD